jgi:hypothetical protein
VTKEMLKIKKLEAFLASRGYSESKYLKAIASEDDASQKINEVHSLLTSVMKGTSFTRDVVPQKISSIPSELEEYCASNGRGDIKFRSNGELRDLVVTLKGGSARDPGSYHGLGLAHDLIILTPKNNNSYVGIGENKDIIKKDPELAKLMKQYGELKGLKWGGDFKRGNAHTLPTGEVVYDTEFHHYEIPKDQIPEYIHPSIKKALEILDIDINTLRSSSGRQKVYQSFLMIIKEKKFDTKPDDFDRNKNKNDERLVETEVEYDPDDSFDLDDESQALFNKIVSRLFL